jgi:hypothetical protein
MASCLTWSMSDSLDVCRPVPHLDSGTTFSAPPRRLLKPPCNLVIAFKAESRYIIPVLLYSSTRPARPTEIRDSRRYWLTTEMQSADRILFIVWPAFYGSHS